MTSVHKLLMSYGSHRELEIRNVHEVLLAIFF